VVSLDLVLDERRRLRGTHGTGHHRILRLEELLHQGFRQVLTRGHVEACRVQEQGLDDRDIRLPRVGHADSGE